MSLAPAPEGGGAPSRVVLEAGAKLRGKVQKVEKFGVFVWLGPGQVGLVPNAWTGTARGTDLARHFPVGKDVDVSLVDATEGGRRIRLTMDEAATAASEDGGAQRGHPGSPAPEQRGPDRPRERDRDRERPERRDAVLPQPAASFGTNLGDALKSALERNRGRAS